MARKSEIRKKDLVAVAMMIAGDLAVCISVYLSFIAGLGEKETQSAETLQKKSKEVEEFTKAKRSEGMLNTELEKSSKTVAPLWSRLEEAHDSPEEVVRLLYDTARRNHVAIASAKSGNIERLSPLFDVVTCEVMASGTFHDLGKFINGLEAGQRYLRIKAFQLTPQEDEAVRAKFDLVIYCMRKAEGDET